LIGVEPHVGRHVMHLLNPDIVKDKDGKKKNMVRVVRGPGVEATTGRLESSGKTYEFPFYADFTIKKKSLKPRISRQRL
jgi:hypothetical protein